MLRTATHALVRCTTCLPLTLAALATVVAAEGAAHAQDSACARSRRRAGARGSPSCGRAPQLRHVDRAGRPAARRACDLTASAFDRRPCRPARPRRPAAARSAATRSSEATSSTGRSSPRTSASRRASASRARPSKARSTRRPSSTRRSARASRSGAACSSPSTRPTARTSAPTPRRSSSSAATSASPRSRACASCLLRNGDKYGSNSSASHPAGIVSFTSPASAR